MATRYAQPRGTRAALTTMAGASALLVGQAYLLTDEARLAVATSVSAFQTFQKQGEAIPTSQVTNLDTTLSGKRDITASVPLSTGKSLYKQGNPSSAYVSVLVGDYKQQAANVTGAIVFSAPSYVANIMHWLDVEGMTYDGTGFLSFKLQGYNYQNTATPWVNAKIAHYGSLRPTVQVGYDASGKQCVVIGDVGTVWQYPHLMLFAGMFSHSATLAASEGWTSALVTSLTGFTGLTTPGTGHSYADIAGSANAVASNLNLPGTPTAATAAQGTNTTQLATTAHVYAGLATKLSLAGGTLTGVVLSTNDVNVNGDNFTVDTTTKSTVLYAYAVKRSGVAVGGILIDGKGAFAAGTTIGGNTAYHAGNFDPSLKADLASPTFTGTPSAPTAAPGTNTTQLATTAYVVTGLNTKAPVASPTFTGTPAAPTAAPGTNTTQLATTAFVATSFAPLASPALTGTPTAPTAAGGTNTTQIATTAFVTSGLASKADLASPALTGTPTAPTAADGTNTTQIATTAHVYSGLSGKEPVRAWQRKTTTYTAVHRDMIQADTSGGAWTLTLPASPAHGTTVQIVDPDGSWPTNNLTIGLNSKTVRGNTGSTVVCDRSGLVSLIFDATEDKWSIFFQKGP